MILAQRDPHQTSDLQNYEIKNVLSYLVCHNIFQQQQKTSTEVL